MFKKPRNTMFLGFLVLIDSFMLTRNVWNINKKSL